MALMGHSLEATYQWPIKQVKQCSTSLAFKEVSMQMRFLLCNNQINFTLRLYIVRNIEKVTLLTVFRKIHWYIFSSCQFGRILAKDLKMFKPCQPVIPFLGICHKGVTGDSCKDSCARLFMSMLHTPYGEGKRRGKKLCSTLLASCSWSNN